MKFLKLGGVILGALVVTTLGINASDIFSGNSGALLGQLISTENKGCPSGMVEVSVGKTYSCIDIYENSTGSGCSIVQPSSNAQTQQNINTSDCASVSIKNATPWTYISREQAQVACARASKRLPTSEEWYVAAIGTPDTKVGCNVQEKNMTATGARDQCRSAVGIYDAIGNVWEWTSDDIFNGKIGNMILPDEGYVKQVSNSGIAVVTDTSPSNQFFSDYAWTNSDGVYGLLRGGFYGSGDDAGVYAIQAKTLPTAATVAIGFRCVL